MKRAILQLQAALRRRFGKRAGNDIGSCMVHISPREIVLVNEENYICAHGPVQVVRVLRRRRKAETGGEK